MSNRVFGGGEYHLLIRLIRNLLIRRQAVRLLFLESRWKNMEKITRLDQEMKKKVFQKITYVLARECLFPYSVNHKAYKTVRKPEVEKRLRL